MGKTSKALQFYESTLRNIPTMSELLEEYKSQILEDERYCGNKVDNLKVYSCEAEILSRFDKLGQGPKETKVE